MSSECDPSSKGRGVAISGVVDTVSTIMKIHGVQDHLPMGERFRLRFDGDEQKLVKISRLGCL